MISSHFRITIYVKKKINNICIFTGIEWDFLTLLFANFTVELKSKNYHQEKDMMKALAWPFLGLTYNQDTGSHSFYQFVSDAKLKCWLS